MLVNSNYRYGGGGTGSSLIIEGYYNNSKFYQDDSFTTQIEGESGKLYVDISTNKTYRWTGSTFASFNADILDGKHASDFACLISNGNMSGIDVSSITGAGVLLKDESTGTVWNVHTHGDQLRIFNGSSEYIMIDERSIGSQSVANAVIARQVISPSSKARLWEDNEGGNLELVSPDGVHMMQMDIYDNANFRMYFYDGSQLTFPANYSFSTGKFDINGNADTVDGKHASDFISISGGTLTGSIITPANDNMGIIPATNNYGQIGSSDKKFFRMYASTFYGALSGNATTATTATKLSTSSAGSATQPVYFSSGKPVACTYTLGKSVPADAVFTDTVPTSLPANGGNSDTVDGVHISCTNDATSGSNWFAAFTNGSNLRAIDPARAYVGNAGNADTVDNLHAWYMATLNADGASHGTSYPMYCRHNVLGDGRFYIGVSGGYERSVAVAFAEKAKLAYNATNATLASNSLRTDSVNSLLVGTTSVNFTTILAWANANSGLACASIVAGNGIPSDAPAQDEAMLRLESDNSGARKIVTWTKFGGTPVIYQRAIFGGNWLNSGWERVK